MIFGIIEFLPIYNHRRAGGVGITRYKRRQHIVNMIVERDFVCPYPNTTCNG